MQTEFDLPKPYHPHARFIAAFESCPLIAIMRGVTPNEVVAHGEALYAAGFRVVEVPLNSPDPLGSIAALRKALPDEVIVGAGTVLRPAFVEDVLRAGGELIVMPHGDTEIISKAKQLGMACAPGVATPTEAFAALASGADVLKMFPAEQLGTAVVKAWRAVIAKRVPLVPVGGVTPDNMAAQIAAGANGFGLGSALYRAGQQASVTAKHAQAFAAAWQTIKASAAK
jgi:2-dehydro-3-deoxyphosphogalactonate aldolase